MFDDCLFFIGILRHVIGVKSIRDPYLTFRMSAAPIILTRLKCPKISLLIYIKFHIEQKLKIQFVKINYTFRKLIIQKVVHNKKAQNTYYIIYGLKLRFSPIGARTLAGRRCSLYQHPHHSFAIVSPLLSPLYCLTIKTQILELLDFY